MKNMKKILVLALAALLLVAVGVGGTLAWLTATSGPVTNTFTPAGIEIELKETQKPDGTIVTTGVTDWTAKLVPGATYSKNPTVKLVKADCDVYIFVTVTNGMSFVEYEVITGEGNWTQVPGETNAWYRTATTSEVGDSWPVINGVTISRNLDATTMPEGNVTLEFNAYAVQQKKEGTTNFTVAEAWAQVDPTPAGT